MAKETIELFERSGKRRGSSASSSSSGCERSASPMNERSTISEKGNKADVKGKGKEKALAEESEEDSGDETDIDEHAVESLFAK